MKRKVLAGLLSAAMVATTVFGSVGVWAAEDAAEETTEETAEDPSDDAAADGSYRRICCIPGTICKQM